MTAGTDTPVGPAREVVIERVLEAPRELVWQAWTDPVHFARWYGPTGMSVTACEIDLAVGGRRFIRMQSFDGQAYHTTGVFREIEFGHRFVVTDAPSDADGNALSSSHYGMPASESLETIVTVTLEDLDGGRTKLTLSQAGFPSADWAAGAGRGWNQSLDKLVEILRGV